MICGKKIVVVMPAYNAGKTLERTFNEIPHEVVDQCLLTDDGSKDDTVIISRKLNIKTFVHEKNKGYGANQKTCYSAALKEGADIIVLLHPDYQYNPRLITAMASLVAEGIYDVVLGSRILGTGAVKGGMPLYKFFGNRFLTFLENIMLNQKLSEYHTGYRAFSRKVFETLPILENSNDFVFDNQILAQITFFGFKVGEVSCPTVYNKESSSISFLRCAKYGMEVLITGIQYIAAKTGFFKISIFDPNGKKLRID
jgi:glycosyltransferase involved in cell wall biosynthesis